MQITSNVFEDGGEIPIKYTCKGEDVNPSLDIADVPSEAKSLALIVDDPDAPAGTWVHWLVWNIDPSTTRILENSSPESSVEGLTNFGFNRYSGPCPPKGHGKHRYFFKLYALDIDLDLGEDTEKKDLEETIKDHILEEAQLMGTYEIK